MAEETPQAPTHLPSRMVAAFNGAHPLGRVIEHVYLTYDGGTPMVHLSRNFIPGADPDLIASMFTAIDNFIDESFHEMGVGSVRSIELGDHHHVAFGKGRWLLLFVMYRGRESNQLERHVIHQVRTIEEQFADLLRNWSGDMDSANTLRDFLARVWFFDHDVSNSAAPVATVGSASASGDPSESRRT
ncbi:MAG TPA: hypothetical protein VEY12_12625 [Thermoplasmata archaeon]|nr:hypothetical protein [Thermoplasmata archaeon]